MGGGQENGRREGDSEGRRERGREKMSERVSGPGSPGKAENLDCNFCEMFR